MFSLPHWGWSFAAGAALLVAPIAPTLQPPPIATPATDQAIWQNVLKLEGGYTNDPVDLGGETNLGIPAALARKHGVASVRSLTKEQAIAIYRKEYGSILDRYTHPGVRSIMADTCVNFGSAPNPRPGTNSCISLSQGLDPNNPQLFIKTVCDRRSAHRRAFIARKPSQARFRNGWDNRDKNACDFARNLAK